MNVRGWTIRLQSPIQVWARAPRIWVCINADCEDAYGPLRRLHDSDDGACKRCGRALRRVEPCPAGPGLLFPRTRVR